MIDIHKSYLEPFFKEMNHKYKNNWCVLHSYETLPFFSNSDVDMAFSDSDVVGLENLIYGVAIKNGWLVLQKLWYDIETCYYYILKDKNSEVYLALDFLIDNKGVGRYGFKTSILTNKCRVIRSSIPVPNHEVAITYKFTKRIVKKRELIEDIKYMDYHFKRSNRNNLMLLLESQFGKKSLGLINKCLENKNYLIDDTDCNILLKNRNEILKQKSSIIIRQILKFKRIIHRIYYPSGIIIYVPILQKEKLELFRATLEKKVDIAFRFVKLNKTNSLINKIKWMSGSTLVICVTSNIKSSGKIRWGWLKIKKINLEDNNLNDMDFLSEIYKEEIIKILSHRKMIRKVL